MARDQTIGFLLSNFTDDDHRLMRLSAREAARSINHKQLSLFERESSNNSRQQLQDLHEALEFGVDGIVIEPLNVDMLAGALNGLAAKNIPIVTVGGSPSNRLAPSIRQVGTPQLDHRIGELQGEFIASTLHNYAPIFHLQSRNAGARKQGLHNRLDPDQHPFLLEIQSLAVTESNFIDLLLKNVNSLLLRGLRDAVLICDDSVALDRLMPAMRQSSLSSILPEMNIVICTVGTQQKVLQNLNYSSGAIWMTIDVRLGEQARAAVTDVSAILDYWPSEQTPAIFKSASKPISHSIDRIVPVVITPLNAADAIPVPASVALDPHLPVALFPVRLETRFVDEKNGETHLLIRIYPDDIFNDAHETELTDEEFETGKSYWMDSWNAGTQDEERQQMLWTALVERFGPTRAAWIVHHMTPRNLLLRPRLASDANMSPSPEIKTRVDAGVRANDWTRAPYAELLPDVWEVRGYATEKAEPIFIQYSKPIIDKLPTGLSPDTRFSFMDKTIKTSRGVRWRVDFRAAELVGMGIRINLTQLGLGKPHKIERLMVVGLKETLGNDGREGARRLATLLQAHQYTWGFDLVPQGSPTNNTADAPSGFSERDPVAQRSYDAAIRDLHRDTKYPTFPPRWAAARRTTQFLGLEEKLLDPVEHANMAEHEDDRAMRTALWPSTLGYYVRTILFPHTSDPSAPDGSLPAGSLSFIREHFIEHVSARGPLSAWRIDKQPYGILPVTLLEEWLPPSEYDRERYIVLKDLLIRLRILARASLLQIPALVPSNFNGPFRDPDTELIRILGMNPVSSEYFVRKVTKAEAIAQAAKMSSKDRASYLENTRASVIQRTWPLFDKARLGYMNPAPAIQTNMYLDGESITAPLVQGNITRDTLRLNEVSDPRNPAMYQMNYILRLYSSTLGQLKAEAAGVDEGLDNNNLLYALLRHASIDHITSIEAGLHSALSPYKEWTNLESTLGSLSASILGSVSASISNLISDMHNWSEVIPTQDTVNSLVNLVNEASTFEQALLHLRILRPWILERLLKETLDVSSHRLDAWITSLASKRLNDLRNDPAYRSGIHIGAFGWVDLLEQKGKLAPVGQWMDDTPIYSDPENQGYIHAPSDTHAATAAILYNGYLSHFDQDSNRNPFAINLTSDRVRDAVWLLDGVRDGQSMGELLGYRFERMLHEAGRGNLIDAFRRFAPLRVGKMTANESQSPEPEVPDQLKTVDAVDGLVLLQRPPDLQSKVNIASDDWPTIERILDRLDSVVDASKDTLLAESVFQMIHGNMMRSGANLDAVARGEVPPPPLDVVRSPRTGTGITHRLLMLCEDENTHQMSPRSRAEPRLDAWASRLFGGTQRLERVSCRVEYQYYDTRDKNIAIIKVADRIISIADLGLSPLDLVYLATNPVPTQLSDIELYLAAVFSLTDWRQPGIPLDARIRFVPADKEDDTLLLGDVIAIAQLARALLMEGGVRPLQPLDLQLHETSSIENNTVLGGLTHYSDELTNRVRQAEKDLEHSILALTKALNVSLPGQIDEMARQQAYDELILALLSFAGFGIPGAIPLTRDLTMVSEQAKGVLREAEERRTRLSAPSSNSAAESLEAGEGTDLINNEIARLKVIFGDNFHVLQAFPFPSVLFRRNDELIDSAQLVLEDWLQRMGQIYEGAARLDQLLTVTETLKLCRAAYFVEQLPMPETTETPDRWVGLPLNTTSLRGSRLSLVAVELKERSNVHQPRAQHNLSGLILDAWNEVIPNPDETTSVVFQYNAPSNTSPQAVLIGVHPNGLRSWDYDTAAKIVSSAIDLAKIRLLDSDAWMGVGHIMPALHFDALITDFSNLTQTTT